MFLQICLYSPFFVTDCAFVCLSMKFLIFLNDLLCTCFKTLKFFLPGQEKQATFSLLCKKLLHKKDYWYA